MAKLTVPTSKVVNSSSFLNLDWLNFIVRLVAQAGVLNGQPCKVAELPATANDGEIRYATDCRVFNGTGTREGAGLGTGGLVTYSTGAGVWRVAGTNVAAAA